MFAPSQRFDLSQAFAGAANLEPSAESLSAQLLLQRMTAAAQDIATKPAAPPSGVGVASAGSQGAITAGTFDRLMEKSSVFQRQRDEQRADFNKLKSELGSNTRDIAGIRSQLGGVAASQSRIEDFIMGKPDSQGHGQDNREGNSSRAAASTRHSDSSIGPRRGVPTYGCNPGKRARITSTRSEGGGANPGTASSPHRRDLDPAPAVGGGDSG